MATTGLFSCGQANKSKPKTIDTETSISSKRLHNSKYFYKEYEYTDSDGKSVIIQNSLPQGGEYTDPNGKEYFNVKFWTRIINETENPIELAIDFPINTYEVAFYPGRYFNLLIPPDTMTLDKEPLPDFGITDLKSFLDNNIHKSSSLKRTINPKESGGFFVAILCDSGVHGPFRTGLSIKGQNLFYKVTRYAGKQGGSLVDEKEINCGNINLKNLIRSHRI
mgnify:CR=1 FL=1